MRTRLYGGVAGESGHSLPYTDFRAQQSAPAILREWETFQGRFQNGYTLRMEGVSIFHLSGAVRSSCLGELRAVAAIEEVDQ
jgi:hypothetical protein